MNTGIASALCIGPTLQVNLSPVRILRAGVSLHLGSPNARFCRLDCYYRAIAAPLVEKVHRCCGAPSSCGSQSQAGTLAARVAGLL